LRKRILEKSKKVQERRLYMKAKKTRFKAYLNRLSVLLAMLIVVSCMDEPTKQFSKNDPIPLGANTVKVSRIEADLIESGMKQSSPYSSGPLSSLSKAGIKSVGVFFEVAGIKGSDSADRKKDRDMIYPRGEIFTLLDKAQAKFDCIGVFPEFMVLHKDPAAATDQMLNLSDDTMQARKYVAIFAVPKESSEFTFFIKNPSIKEGQPSKASVAFGK
jgi:hypothetical protein